MDDAARDVEAPKLPSGVRLGLAVRELIELQGHGEFVHATTGVLLGHRVEAALQEEVFVASGFVVGSPELADVPDALSHLLRSLADVETGDRRLTAINRQQRREHAQRRGLPRTVRTQEPEDAPAPTSRLTPSTAFTTSFFTVNDFCSSRVWMITSRTATPSNIVEITTQCGRMFSD